MGLSRKEYLVNCGFETSWLCVSDSVRPQRWQPTTLRRPWDSPGKHTGVGCHFLLQCMKLKSEREVTESCPTLSDPMDCSPPGFSVHGIFQARVLEWGAVAFSQVALVVKKPPTNAGGIREPWGQKDPLEEGMAAHSSFLAWEIPWTEELQFMGLQKIGQDSN